MFTSALKRYRPHAAAEDRYVESILEGCHQVGVPEEPLSPAAVSAALTDEFGNERPSLEQAFVDGKRRGYSRIAALGD